MVQEAREQAEVEAEGAQEQVQALRKRGRPKQARAAVVVRRVSKKARAGDVALGADAADADRALLEAEASSDDESGGSSGSESERSVPARGRRDVRGSNDAAGEAGGPRRLKSVVAAATAVGSSAGVAAAIQVRQAQLQPPPAAQAVSIPHMQQRRPPPPPHPPQRPPPPRSPEQNVGVQLQPLAGIPVSTVQSLQERVRAVNASAEFILPSVVSPRAQEGTRRPGPAERRQASTAAELLEREASARPADQLSRLLQWVSRKEGAEHSQEAWERCAQLAEALHGETGCGASAADDEVGLAEVLRAALLPPHAAPPRERQAIEVTCMRVLARCGGHSERLVMILGAAVREAVARRPLPHALGELADMLVAIACHGRAERAVDAQLGERIRALQRGAAEAGVALTEGRLDAQARRSQILRLAEENKTLLDEATARVGALNARFAELSDALSDAGEELPTGDATVAVSALAVAREALNEAQSNACTASVRASEGALAAMRDLWQACARSAPALLASKRDEIEALVHSESELSAKESALSAAGDAEQATAVRRARAILRQRMAQLTRGSSDLLDCATKAGYLDSDARQGPNQCVRTIVASNAACRHAL